MLGPSQGVSGGRFIADETRASFQKDWLMCRPNDGPPDAKSRAW